MTLQQLKYVTTIANIGSISEAAKRLFVSQPSLTKAIKELEKEMGITIFDRTNKGITVSKEGERFLGYARQVLEQAALLEEQYKSQSGGKKQFSVSTQHYSFAVNAFVELLKGADIDQYDVSLRETQTYEIIDDVAHMKSEIGLLFYNDFNRPVLEKLIHTNELTFTELFTAHPHIFIGKNHPLANKDVVSMDELEEYPYISFEQGDHNSFYFSEEIFSTVVRPKHIRVRDRASLFSLLLGLDGYTVSSGVIDEEVNGENIISVPLAEEGLMHIGYITNNKMHRSRLGQEYIQALEQYVGNYGRHIKLPKTKE
ncbi:LysR family transcriptional regulator [Veillonella sp.]|uniref:LysR family transcriptional regulator n=1 Tax=Veillonella sp. TaxID=1926307 RepID=UPI00257B3B82|nr:LysR family transcriptional regulator [Veillonella sp.]MBS4891217.1 LysR family transcriptional regulator [Veillonella sp.]MBS6659526.1 LysR family transcriptional regulator [Veillonella sp.]MDU3276533.1 LysR family transcriptional regulator [Veillonella sp.]MDU4757091.1 LysR family transcriptional regulator [Veillonella sp.]